MCTGTHGPFWNSVQVVKCPYSLFYVQNLIKKSLIYLLILDVLPIYFSIFVIVCFFELVFSIHIYFVMQRYSLHF